MEGYGGLWRALEGLDLEVVSGALVLGAFGWSGNAIQTGTLQGT